MQSKATTALAIVGALSLSAAALRVLRFIKINCLTHTNLKARYAVSGSSSNGSWAVVTGASEGIGYGLAMDLAKRGFNVCVIARMLSKLEAVVTEIRALGVEARAISFDFSTATPADYAALFQQLDTLSLAVLVNNVGVNYSCVSSFEEVDMETHQRLIKVNCESAVQMSHWAAPKLKARKAGAIVLLSSFSALFPTPLLATYAATKAFCLSFAEALVFELKPFNVDVLAVTPNVVVSKMTQGVGKRPPRETFMMVNAEQMAHQTLDKLGAVTQTSGHRNHALFEALYSCLSFSRQGKMMYRYAMGVKARIESKAAAAK